MGTEAWLGRWRGRRSFFCGRRSVDGELRDDEDNALVPLHLCSVATTMATTTMTTPTLSLPGKPPKSPLSGGGGGSSSGGGGGLLILDKEKYEDLPWFCNVRTKVSATASLHGLHLSKYHSKTLISKSDELQYDLQTRRGSITPANAAESGRQKASWWQHNADVLLVKYQLSVEGSL